MKCSIVGYGKMGQIRASAIINCGGEITAIYDPSSNNLNTDSLEDCFSNEIDVVFVCTPNFLNKEMTIKAIRAGKHVFCEKPPALNSKELSEVQECVEKYPNIKLMYGFNHRQHASVLKAKELIDSGEFGKLLWMRGRYGKSVDKDFFSNWRADKTKSGGGILIDQGIHMLDLFLHFAGAFHEKHAFVSNQYWEKDGIEDNVFAIFKNNETKVTASLHSTMTQWRHLFSLELFLEKGYLVINGLKTPSGTYGEETLTVAKNRTKAPMATWESEIHEVYPIDKSWEREISHFFECIKNDKNVKFGNLEDSIKIMKLIDEVYCEHS